MGPWVLESGYRYAKASAILLNVNLMGESEVNAALAMELLLKSLLVVPVANPRQGTVMEQYTLPKGLGIKDGHDLYQLYLAIPKDVATKLNLHGIEDVLQKKRTTFKSTRYCYEVTAPGGYDSLLLQAVSWLLPQVVVHFVDSGCTDQWVAYMHKHPEKMRLDQLGDPAA